MGVGLEIVPYYYYYIIIILFSAFPILDFETAKYRLGRSLFQK